jgi:hypothetical protein
MLRREGSRRLVALFTPGRLAPGTTGPGSTRRLNGSAPRTSFVATSSQAHCARAKTSYRSHLSRDRRASIEHTGTQSNRQVNVMSEPRTPLLILSLSVSEHKVLRKDTDYVATLQLDFQ